MLAIGAGGLDVALAMAGKPFYLTMPKVIGINLSGTLPPWVSAKDVILKVLDLFTTKGNVGCVFEYGGEGTAGLTVAERQGVRGLRVEAAGLDKGVPAELSEGTADQVFLALRLAGIRQTQRRAIAGGGVPLPVVLDDVLVTHDDDRTAAAVAVLAEEARDQQILLLTHHADAARAARATDATIVELARWRPGR
jgi:hypothetical protein